LRSLIIITWNLLDKEYQRKSIYIFILVIIGTLLEMIGISAIVPIISSMNTNKFPHLLGFMESYYLNIDSIIIFLVLIFIIFYISKLLYLSWLSWKQSEYIYSIKSNISQRLFNCYLDQNYDFYLNKNSSELIRNIASESALFATGVLVPLVLLLTELLVVLGIAIILFYVEPAGASIIFSITLIAMFFLNNLTKKNMKKWGELRQILEGKRIQIAQEGLGGIKELKLLGREDYIKKRYEHYNFGGSSVEMKQLAFLQLPRFILEGIATIGLGLLVVILINKGDGINTVIPVLGLFAVAGFRLLPSASKIVTSIQSLKYSSAIILLIKRELNISIPSNIISSVDIVFEKSISLVNVSFSYPNSITPVLECVNISIKKNNIVGIIGASGAGKSTLVDIILGLLIPVAGEVRVDDININFNLRSWQQKIGYVPQSIFLSDDTLKANIAFGLNDSDINNESLIAAIKGAQLEPLILNLPDGLNTMLGERGIRLSGGQRQRIGIARALYNNPSVLVFDEATSALDNKTEEDVMDSINALKGTKTIIIIAHRLSTLNKCDFLVKVDCQTAKELSDISMLKI